MTKISPIKKLSSQLNTLKDNISANSVVFDKQRRKERAKTDFKNARSELDVDFLRIFELHDGNLFSIKFNFLDENKRVYDDSLHTIEVTTIREFNQLSSIKIGIEDAKNLLKSLNKKLSDFENKESECYYEYIIDSVNSVFNLEHGLEDNVALFNSEIKEACSSEFYNLDISNNEIQKLNDNIEKGKSDLYWFNINCPEKKELNRLSEELKNAQSIFEKVSQEKSDELFIGENESLLVKSLAMKSELSVLIKNKAISINQRLLLPKKTITSLINDFLK